RVERLPDLLADVDRLQAVHEEHALEVRPERRDVHAGHHLEEVRRVSFLRGKHAAHDALVDEHAGRELERLLEHPDDRQVHRATGGVERADAVSRHHTQAALVRHELVRACGRAVHDGRYAITSYPPDCCCTNESRLAAWRPWSIEINVTMNRMSANIATVMPVRKRLSIGYETAVFSTGRPAPRFARRRRARNASLT